MLKDKGGSISPFSSIMLQFSNFLLLLLCDVGLNAIA